MKFLLDENLESVVAKAASAMVDKRGDSFVSMKEINAEGIKDPEIPALARKHQVACFITANVRDFGAKKFYFEALLAEDLHVCVLRPPRTRKFNGPQQLSLLMQNYEAIRNHIDRAASPVLMIANLSGVRIRTIDELIAEFGSGQAPLLNSR